MGDNSDSPDTIHVSPWLVKAVSASILTGLGVIAGWMAIWNRSDAEFKATVLISIGQIREQVAEIRGTLSVVPSNTQKILDIQRRVDRLEDDHSDYERRKQ